MDHPKAGNMDAGREVLREQALDTVVSDEKMHGAGLSFDEKAAGANVDEKPRHSVNDTSDSDDGTTPHVYELDNMVRDENGRLVVETSELAVTVLHVDDDITLSPWTFRTFFIGTYIRPLRRELD